MNFGDTCSLCKRPSVLACSRCTEPYCSPGCQTKDWIRHRHFCIAMPPLVCRNEIQQLYDEIANSSSVSDPELGEMIAYCQIRETKSEKIDVPKSKIIRTAVPPAPLKEMNTAKPQMNLAKIETSTNPESSAEMLKWQEKVSMSAIPRKEVEVVIHKYDLQSREAWLVLTKDKQELSSMMTELNKTVKALHPAPAEMIRVGQLFAVLYTEKIYGRGEVLAVSANGSGYTVLMIDYGDVLQVTADKMKLPMPTMLSTKRFAFPVCFRDGRQRTKMHRLLINFLVEPNDPRQMVETCDPVGTTMMDFMDGLNVKKFEGSVATILNKSCYFVQFTLPEKLALKKEELADVSRFEVADRLKKGHLFVVEEPEQPRKRGLVVEIDEKLGMCVVFMYDLGILKTMQIPKKPRLLPYYLALLPAQTLFIRVDKILTQNQSQFIESFCQKVPFTFDIVTKHGGNLTSYEAKISLGKTVLATAKIFTGPPDLKKYDLSVWSICSESKTPIKVLKANIGESLEVVIHPAHNMLHCKKLLENVSVELLTAMPAVNDVVIFTMHNKTSLRCIVLRIDAKNIEVSDLDTSVKYCTDISSLKVAPELIKNMPVYTMRTQLSDCPSFTAIDTPYLAEFFDLSHLKRRELVLMYEGHPINGVQLLLGYGSDSLIKKMTEFINEKKKEVADKLAAEEKARLQALADEEAFRVEARKRDEERAQQRKEMELAEAKAKLRLEIPKPEPVAKSTEMSKLDALKAAIAEEEERMRKEAEMSPLPNGILFDDLKLMPLPLGKPSDLLILDVMPDKSMMAICEYSVPNLKFVEEVITLVDSYVESIDSEIKKGYKPSVREMCLALYEDGSWYRAVCIERPTPVEFKLNLIDFGTTTVVTSDKIIAFPEVLMKPPPRTYLGRIKGMTAAEIVSNEAYTKKKFIVESCTGGFCDIIPA